MNISILPSINASLNAASAILLILGFLFIKNKNVGAHKTCMLSACVTSALFLASYLTYHYFHGATHFPGHGVIKVFYFVILISHTILAAATPVFVGMTLYQAFRGNFTKHVAVARITLPIWLYVSATGVIVYWMLYQTRY